MDYKTLTSQEHSETSVDIRARVEKARAIQRERFKTERGTHTNATMTPRLIRRHCELDAEASGYLEHAMSVGAQNVLDAIGYRTLDRALWS